MRAALTRMFWYSAMFIYVVFPIDCIPDLIPVLGWIDDVGMLIYGISQVRAAGAAGRSLVTVAVADDEGGRKGGELCTA